MPARAPLLACLLVSSCTTPPLAPNATSFLDGLSAAECDKAIRCGLIAPSERVDCVHTWPATSARYAYPRFDDARRAFDEGRRAFSPDAAAQCLADWLASDCRAFVPPSCAAVYPGTVAGGSACETDDDCAAGYCAATRGACSRACILWLPSSAPCTRDAECGPSAFCDPQTSICQPLRDRDNFCSSNRACRPGLVCVPSTSGDLCEPLRAATGSCYRSTDCQPGLYCNDLSHTCLARAAARQPCLVDDNCESPGRCACADGLRCTRQPLEEHTCLEPRDLAAPCDDVYATCSADALCDFTNRCARGHQVGEICDACLAAVYEPPRACDEASDRCVELPAPGDPCDANSPLHCPDGYACQGGVCARVCAD